MLEPTSGYYYDPKTGFLHDKASGYYYDPFSKEWLFWTKTYKTFIPRKGGDEERKKELLLEELKAENNIRAKKENSEVIVLDSDEEGILTEPSTSQVNFPLTLKNGSILVFS